MAAIMRGPHGGVDAGIEPDKTGGCRGGDEDSHTDQAVPPSLRMSEQFGRINGRSILRINDVPQIR